MRKVHPMLPFALAAVLIFIANSCNTPTTDNAVPEGTTAKDSTVKKDDQLIMALLYQQRAAEYRALCFQCYNIAKQRVKEAIQNSAEYKSGKPFAVVTDLDETAIDNSANEAWLYVNDSAYNPAENLQWSIYG